MSLLDDVSIVVTPNGYKAGTLYGVLPTYAEGIDLVTNGGFDSGSNWSTPSSWEIIDGKLEGTNVNAVSTTQAGFLFLGKTFLVTYTLSDYVQGNVRVYLGGTQPTSNRSANGTYSEYITITTANTTLYIQGISNFTGNIDNISVKEVTSADMDVTRTTAATRVDEDGLVNYAEVISETEEVINGDFATDSDWSKGGGATISGGQANIDGDGTSFTSITQSNVFTEGKRYKVTTDVIITSGLGLKFQDGANNENIGFATTTGSYEFYFTATSNTSFVIGRRTGGTAFDSSVDNVSVKELTRDNVPRIDYTGGGCPHILAEPQRTNLITYSEDFSQWNNTNTTDAISTINSPDGTQNATTITASGSGVLNHIISSDDFTIASGDITGCIFAKKGTVDYLRLRFDGTTNNERAWYNLNNGTIDGEDSSGSAKIEDFGNGWYRCILTSSNNTASGDCGLQVFVQDSGGTQTSWEADGTENIHIWGAQTEQGSYPTSYIPNFGTLLGVTRNQDIFTRDGIGSLINDSEGVLFAEIAAQTKIGFNTRNI